MKVRSESEVTQSCPTLSNAMDCSLPGSAVLGIFQARVAFSNPYQTASVCTPPALQTPFSFWQVALIPSATSPVLRGGRRHPHPSEALGR